MRRSGRDEELGERLRRLEVPEHAPDFFASLERRLAATSARARSRRARVWIPVAAAMAAGALIWALVGPLGVGVLGPETVSAAEIAQRASTAVAQARALRGTLIVALPGGYEGGQAGAQEDALEETSWRFVCTAEGDFLLTGIGYPKQMAFDHQSGVERSLFVGSGMANASEFTGLAAGPPDPAPSEYLLDRQLGAVVRALRDSPQALVSEGTYEGRPVWALDADVQPNRLSNVSGDHLVVTVDQATGFPVKAVETKAGVRVHEFRLEDFEIDPQVTPGTFVLEFPSLPSGVEIYRDDFGFDRVDPSSLHDQAATVVGYMPVLPATLPSGFTLAEVTVAAVGQPTGKEGMNPAATGVVSAIYRRGFDRLVVSTRQVGLDASLWTDPLSSGEGFIDQPEKVVLGAGAFAGSTAELLIDPRAVPHLWAINSALVLTVSGDLTRDEMLAVAESLAEVK